MTGRIFRRLLCIGSSFRQITPIPNFPSNMPVRGLAEKQQLQQFKFPLTPTTANSCFLQPSHSPRNRSVSLPSKAAGVPPSRLPRLRPPPLNLNLLPPSPTSTPLRTPTKIPIRDSYGETGLLCPAPIRCRPFTKPDPRLLLRHLRSVLGPEALKIQENMGIDDLIALHEREMMEKQEKEIIKSRQSNDWNLSIFGTSLRQVSLYASTTAILGGYEHDLPILVFACIEELYQRGLKNSIYSDPSSIPSPRVTELQNLFNSSPRYGLDVNLEPESDEDVYSLLLSFLQRLPEPVLGSTQIVEGIKQSIWEWCVLTTTGRRRLCHSTSQDGPSVVYIDEEKDERLYRKSLMGAVVSSHRADADESTQITIVQHLLRLLPSANLSTFVYLLAFLNQIIVGLLGSDLMDSTTIDSGREELGRLFGKWIFGNRIRDSWGSEEQVDASAVMMVWFLTRWESIADGLFSMGKTRKAAEPKGSTNTSQGPSVPKTSSPNPTKAASKHDALEELLALLADNNAKAFDAFSIKSIEAEATEDENLLDVTLPALDSSFSESIDSEANSPSSVSSFASSSRVRLPSISDSGFRVLESKFQMQNSDAKLERSDFCGSAQCKSYTESLEERLRMAMKERDEAWAIVDDIRKMMADASV